jgi:cytochrome c553
MRFKAARHAARRNHHGGYSRLACGRTAAGGAASTRGGAGRTDHGTHPASDLGARQAGCRHRGQARTGCAAAVLIQLYLFRENQRKVDVMNEAAKGLTDDDLRQLSDLVAKLPAPKPPPESPDPARMERGRELAQKYRCGFCHDRDFAGHDNVPRLAAQREDYLIKSLREYKANSRPGYDATMAEVTQPIPEAEILDLAYFMARAR